ncbi:MAG: RloB domain-containing protein [Cryomorphaceae bacterium]|nr:MAG: RloB domain-containing protein [Cryomorphaceae bacterium]
MARKRRAPKGKKMNPTFFVFCEGETEEAYVHFLKRHFRLPSIQIHSRVSRNKITARYIKNYKQDKPQHEKDRDFLMYDLDVPKILARLKKIKGATLLVSNPCIELWFLLHFKNHQGECDPDFCTREMRNRNKGYQKGDLSTKLEEKLSTKMDQAVTRAKALEPFQNPSSTVYRLIEALLELRK